MINFWATLAGQMLPADRWSDLFTYGTQLFVAHHLTVGKRDQLAAEAGGVSGEIKGPITSKSVDKVSVSYSSQSVALKDGGFWNSTSYGVRFLQLARMIGSGPIQL